MASSSSTTSPLRLLSLAAFLSTLDRFAVPPLLVGIAASFGVPLSEAAPVASGYFLLYGCSQLFWGMLSDRLGRVVLMRLAFVGAAACGVLSALAPTLWLLVLARTLTGGFFGAVIPTTLVYVGDTVPLAARPKAFADLSGANAVAIVAATLGAGLAASLVSWRAGFLLPAVGAALLAAVLRGLPEPASAERARPLAGLGLVVRRPWALLVVFLAFTEGAIVFGAYTFLAAALQATGFGPAVAGLAVAAFGVAMLALSRVVKAAEAAVPPAGWITIGAGFLAAGYAIAAASQSPAGVLSAAALVGGGFACMHPMLQTWATDVAPEARATAISLFATALFVGSALGTALAAPLAERGDYGGVFGAAALIALPLGLVAALGRARYRSVV